MYDQSIDEKWQKEWYNSNYFSASDDKTKKKFYGLVEFPYPSGVGLHVGHVKAYIGMDVIARMKRLEGYNVLFPIGWDAFGLPTENYAIKTGTHPRLVTNQNIAKFTKQLKAVGFSFDFNRQVDTTDPKYYKWTQWIFLKLFEKGLAYKDKTEVNYCSDCQVVLANEESQGGKCDRCGRDVVQKEKEVWMLKITDYAEKLLEGLNEMESLERIKVQQENWIGKSEGAEINFKLNDIDEILKVYTTRPDTIFGATFMVIAPEHPLIKKYHDKIENIDEILKYAKDAKRKTEFERVQLVKDKSGIEVKGIEAINPINNEKIPLWVADYVMIGYGTGAIMAVPAHDERDFEFAKKYGIEIREVISDSNANSSTISSEDKENHDLKAAYTGKGVVINSLFLNGLDMEQAKEKAISYIEKEGLGKRKTNYHMKDWAFARQRYWGEPLPIIKCERCGLVPLKESDLPLELPQIADFKPSANGESPLAKAHDWVNVTCPKCNRAALRETDTMPQWAGSSWYFLRYIDPQNDLELASLDNLKYWLPVDWYNGGMEHVTRHLIYSRFWYRFLYDIGVVPTKEPYAKRTVQGLILGADGEKMSKSRGNVINPDEIILEYGADTLRIYVLFMGEYDEAAPWNENGVKGVKKFLDRVMRLDQFLVEEYENKDKELERELNITIKKVSEDYSNMKYNTAIAQMMIYVNLVYKKRVISKEDLSKFLIVLNPVAPHVTEEIWNRHISNETILKENWPSYDEKKIVLDEVEIAVQINGVVRFKIKYGINMSKEEIENIVISDERLKPYINGKSIQKVIIVPNKIVNIVIK